MTRRTIAPITVEASPMKRSWPSDNSVSRRNASRHVCGARSGRRPSRTSTNAHAARKVSGTSRASPALVPVLLCAGTRRGLANAGLLQVLEEFRVRIEHHQVVLVVERRLVRLEAAIEGIELGILSIRGSVDPRRLGITFALDLLCLAVRIGQDNLALPVRVRTDLLRLRRALRAQLVRHALALRF